MAKKALTEINSRDTNSKMAHLFLGFVSRKLSLSQPFWVVWVDWVQYSLES